MFYKNSEYVDQTIAKDFSAAGDIRFLKVHATKCIKITGNFSSRESIFWDVFSCGNTVIDKSVINNNAKLVGPVEVKESEFGELDITGDTIIADSKVNSKASFVGNVKSVHCTFHDVVGITSKEFEVVNCSFFKDIVIFPVDLLDREEQVLTLKEGSIVEGDVYFKSGRGRVILETGSIVRGAIILENAPRFTPQFNRSSTTGFSSTVQTGIGITQVHGSGNSVVGSRIIQAQPPSSVQ